ncbi:hypothetical protein LTR85_002274 [Meristemomyces frigidus]|nr:hypothetical protein LTR85_002274 [Meristemomyces frigidus]
MQTRADFLATGLAPVPNDVLSTLTGLDLDCSICAETLADPVSLPCHHIFDKACIVHWLEMPGKNTCPSCRRPLFDMPLFEPPEAAPNAAQMFYEALGYASPAVGQLSNDDGADIPGLSPAVPSEARVDATQYLFCISSGIRLQWTGPTRIDADALADHVAAMGYLLPSMSRIRGTPYTRREMEDWQTLLDRLHVVLARKNGKRYEARVMARKLRQKMNLRGLILHHDVDASGFLITDNGLTAELDTLLDYVTHVSYMHGTSQERARQAARRAAAVARGQRPRVNCAVM